MLSLYRAPSGEADSSQSAIPSSYLWQAEKNRSKTQSMDCARFISVTCWQCMSSTSPVCKRRREEKKKRRKQEEKKRKKQEEEKKTRKSRKRRRCEGKEEQEEEKEGQKIFGGRCQSPRYEWLRTHIPLLR